MQVCFLVPTREEDDLVNAIRYDGEPAMAPSPPKWYSEIALWKEYPKLLPWDSSDDMPMWWRNRINSYNKCIAVANYMESKKK